MEMLNDQPVFSAELIPYRSLGRKGFRILLVLCALFAVLYGGFFLVTGAWPIGFFLGLDFLLLYIAFRANYRAAKVKEQVVVSRTNLSIRKFSPKGDVVEHRFNPFWARFSVARHAEIGITKMTVEGQGQNVPIGGFLDPESRESFATAFSRALATAKAR